MTSVVRTEPGRSGTPILRAKPSTKRILIVDDSALMRSMLRAMLHADHGRDWLITEAASGEEFLRTLAVSEPFDMILLDVQMPGMGGFAACTALREVDKRVPVVFVTAERDLESFRAGRRVGGDTYLVKPVTQAALRSAISTLMSLERKPVVGPELATVEGSELVSAQKRDAAWESPIAASS